MSSPFLESPLKRGRRRRRGRRAAAIVALTTAVVAVAAVALLTLAPNVLLSAEDWLFADRGSGSLRVEQTRRNAGVLPSDDATLPRLGSVESRATGPAPHGGSLAVSLGVADAFNARFKKPPRAGLVFELDSGRVLWRRRSIVRAPIASLTKIMTALLVVDQTKPRERAKITAAAVDYEGRGVGLPKGKRVPVESLLNGLLITSGNDAAKALAIHVSGSERSFVRAMNERARQLGLTCTHFVSPHGLEPGNRSCAADLAALSRIAMDEWRIARVVRKSSAGVRAPVKGDKLYVNTTNPLLTGAKPYKGTIGLKTGTNRAAGHCYVGIVERGGKRLGVVLLDSPNVRRQARSLLNRAFRESRPPRRKRRRAAG